MEEYLIKKNEEDDWYDELFVNTEKPGFYACEFVIVLTLAVFGMIFFIASMLKLSDSYDPPMNDDLRKTHERFFIISSGLFSMVGILYLTTKQFYYRLSLCVGWCVRYKMRAMFLFFMSLFIWVYLVVMIYATFQIK